MTFKDAQGHYSLLDRLSPAGLGRTRLPDVFWYIVGITLHLFACLNDE